MNRAAACASGWPASLTRGRGWAGGIHGTACFGGSLSNQWTVRDFSPNEYLPKGVRLAGYFGDAADLPREAFQEIPDAVAPARLAFLVDRVYDGLEQVPQAHDDMEHDRATGNGCIDGAGIRRIAKQESPGTQRTWICSRGGCG